MWGWAEADTMFLANRHKPYREPPSGDGLLLGVYPTKHPHCLPIMLTFIPHRFVG